MLDVGKTSDLIHELDKDEYQTVSIRSILQNTGKPGNPRMVVINESGLYHAIFKSRKPEAKKVPALGD